ncbi:hypothetical protein Hanom_Chr09g00851521 [Helianthus anomalus]
MMQALAFQMLFDESSNNRLKVGVVTQTLIFKQSFGTILNGVCIADTGIYKITFLQLEENMSHIYALNNLILDISFLLVNKFTFPHKKHYSF